MANILDDLKQLAVNGNKFYRKKENLCILLGAGCEYYITSLNTTFIRIDSSKPLTPAYLMPKIHTAKFYKYEANIKDILADKQYHINRLESIADGFGVMPTEDAVFKEFITNCMDLILPSLRELLEIEDLEYVGEVFDLEYGGKNGIAGKIFLDKLLEFSSKKLGGIILQLNMEMQNDRRPNEIDRELVYIGRIFGEYTPTSSEKKKSMVYNIENKKARSIWFYVGNTTVHAPKEYSGVPIVIKEIRERETKRTLDHMQIISVYMANHEKLNRNKYKHTRKLLKFLTNPNISINSKDVELKAFGDRYYSTLQGKVAVSMNALEAIYQRDIMEVEFQEVELEIQKMRKERDELSTEKAELTVEKAELTAEKAELTAEKAELTAEKAELTTEVQQLSTKNAELEAKLREYEKLLANQK
ncbi:MAG: hypothetical protein ATN35_10570 [Epulopiscium sp. Nele67-Bin004]|nr:MAG: hypothetical protein ATN35_10570 [Epulopiscium sp. Nele67-Bin004]